MKILKHRRKEKTRKYSQKCDAVAKNKDDLQVIPVTYHSFYKAMPVNKTNEMILKDLNSKNKMQQKAKKRLLVSRTSAFFSQKLSNMFQKHKVVPWCSGVVVIRIILVSGLLVPTRRFS